MPAPAPFVSVILPVYNRAASLGRAIESVLAQDPPPDELIVVDDGSEEDLSPVLGRYAGRIVTHRQPNGGVSAARNAGARLARGRWLAFVDSDDEWTPGHMAVLYRDLAAPDPDVVVHLGDVRFLGHDHDAGLFALKGQAFPEDRALRLERPVALVIGGMSCDAAAVRTDVFRRIGGFDESLRYLEDTALFGRLLAEGAFLVTGRTLAIGHRLEGDENALTRLERRDPMMAVHIYLRTLEPYFALDLAPEDRRLVQARRSGALLRLAQAEAETRTGRGAGRSWRTLVAAAKAHPDPLRGWTKSLAAAALGAPAYRFFLDRRKTVDRS